MADLLLEPELRHRKERLGIQRAGLFNWNRSALATLEVYREVTKAKRTPARAGHRAVVAGKGK
jgi:hypothetical protein